MRPLPPSDHQASCVGEVLARGPSGHFWFYSSGAAHQGTRAMSVESELREEAMERAGGICEFPGCSYPRPLLEVAHLHGKQAGGSKFRDVLDNLVCLCRPHHDWLDCRSTPNMRRFENEMVLRKAIGREWKDRQ